MNPEKTALRKKMAHLRAVCPERAERDALILQKLLGHPEILSADRILCYVSFGAEVDTHMFLRHCLQKGKAVFVPRCLSDSNEMVFHRIQALSDLIPGMWGIPEPPIAAQIYTADPAKKDICIAPGLAFTWDGMRLGYGKGYYDRFLHRNPMLTIGLCYGFQLVDSVYAQEHDYRLDQVLSDLD